VFGIGLIGSIDGIKETDGFMDGTDDNVGIKEGEAEGLMDGGEEEVGVSIYDQLNHIDMLEYHNNILCRWIYFAN